MVGGDEDVGAALLHMAHRLLQRVSKGAKRVVGSPAQSLQHGGQVTGAKTVTDLTPQGDGTCCACVGDKPVGDALVLQCFAHRPCHGETGLQPLFPAFGAFALHVEQNGSR